MNLKEATAIAREEAEKRQLEYDYDHREQRANMEGVKRKIRALPMRPATKREYRAWLEGYISGGGQVAGYRDTMPEIFIAKAPLEIPDHTCGALSFGIIAPVGIAITHEGFDHCQVFYMEGFTAKGSNVHAYGDIL